MSKYTEEELRKVDDVCLAIEKMCGIAELSTGAPRKGFAGFMQDNYADEIKEEAKTQHN